jgi:hypothetical protein
MEESFRTNNHQAGVLLELDTFVNGNDQAPVLTDFGYSRFEQKFSAPQIPDYWQAFQIGNPADSTGLVAQGSLVGYNAVRPDQLIIGDWSRLSTVQWDYDVPANPPRYDDSAVILRWNEQNLAASRTRKIWLPHRTPLHSLIISRLDRIACLRLLPIAILRPARST